MHTLIVTAHRINFKNIYIYVYIFIVQSLATSLEPSKASRFLLLFIVGGKKIIYLLLKLDSIEYSLNLTNVMVEKHYY